MSEFIPNQVAIEELLDDPVGPVGRLMESIGVKGEEIAKRLAPVDDGDLRDSITHRLDIYRGTPGVVIGTPIRYAIYQEFGTVQQPGTPFLRPMLYGLTV